MVFNSVVFLIFFSIFLPVFFLLKGTARMIFTLLASYLFYGWWDWRFLSLLMASTVIDYFIALQMSHQADQAKRRYILMVSLICNLGILGFFKYFNFFISSFYDLLNQIGLPTTSHLFHIILPVGISFYTFQTLSYTIDVYYRKIPVEKDFIKFATFISFFPQLVAGPIVRASDFIPQLYDNHRKPVLKNILSGLDLVAVGFLKKVVIADSLAPVVEGGFKFTAEYSSLQLIICIVFYSFQIYCDFSGYSDIAIGLARMLGYHFPVNFNIPYISASFSEFWTRWHISLSGWLRDYLYIPLGGNRKGKWGTYKNLMITMLLGGLWHGANWTFILWGFLHGMYLVLQRFTDKIFSQFNLYPQGAFGKIVFRIGCIIIVYVAVCFAWIFFRAPDMKIASLYIDGILNFNDLSFHSLVNKFWIVKGTFLIIVLYIMEIVGSRYDFEAKFNQSPLMRVLFYAIVIWSVSLLGTFADNQFIYFQF